WGVVNDTVRATLDELHRADERKLIYVDSRRHLGRFRCGVLKGNRSEVLSAAGVDQENIDGVAESLQRLMLRTGSSSFCTMGEQGILVARHGLSPRLV